MIGGIDHFVLTVADIEVTLSFYERVLGFKRLLSPGKPTALVFGLQKINLHEIGNTFDPKAKRPTPAAADFCLVANRPLSEIRFQIQRKGVAIEVGPVERLGARGKMTSIYFRDPDGNLIEICEYL